MSEAWIDDLSRWVLLDGQNGAWWTDRERPLGVLDLQERHAAGRGPAQMASEVTSHDHSSVETWWSYFATAQTSGFAWGRPFAGIFQSTKVVTTATLLHDPRTAYPDLDQVGVGLGGDSSAPHFRLQTNHPYATGFDSAGRAIELEDPILPVDLGSPGEHDVPVRVRTPYGHGREHVIRHVVRD